MSKDLWFQEYENIGEEYWSGDIEREEAADRLKVLGFDPDEITDELDKMQSE